jgi:hypothetical protein
MKSTILISILLFISFYCHSQTKKKHIDKEYLIGLWQIDDSIVGDVLDKNFRFYTNDTFKLTEDEYDDLNRIRIIRGIYRLDTSWLILKVKNHDELIGGKLVPGYMGVQFQEFVIRGGEIKTIDDSDIGDAKIWIQNCDAPLQGHNCESILIGSNEYYKISNNPDAYK